ncbi:bifunctional methylenetetrahydrofolate dehydrogenase/methenyltetrahydrofolate cyclohydrolase FolD [Pseudogracilibacillus auburnensis]|uniref:Bifunctional protein FolD n=1 Tax=Pseudogracilibacillus auburnensis TaxID=1494959 RepID=A0A2V3VT42_9BACI|nr:bifunctional methylenetetrahydrofolate dehydrogenase/methenyltetrahydrofolate cyclohydrolase FolD [Pseudogracilibacillus auburnensis]MBO1004300.1 bifunctional methylenetetrahydrofolate dehydrogenase/methenyltetrahydrofolate cyclohydrolase FolD [Pseudogracilibacillus auburnensis]PXW85052.1 methenyltetrahydrofolate cyclohydrolase /5,10-methylenetetrahydrofolate dehydrogenase (NADP+) [Pseudogracilibacillus auburnensis]
MVAEIINGKDLAKQLREEMKEEVKQLTKQGITAHLSVILIGDDPASHSYVNGKEKASTEVGISSEIIRMDTTISEEQLVTKINELNNDDSVHGILVQLPIPDHINEQRVIESIDPKKDVDGFHPINIGRMMVGQDAFLPCTPYGIMTMLQSKKIQVEGKHVVVIGRSNIVGKPMGQLLLNNNATVTYCHSRTKDLKSYTKQADILIVAIGKEHVIDASFIKDDAVVIDVGVNRTAEGRLTGDVDFDHVKEKASFITPVPKGVGPMTITMLLKNTIKAAKGLKQGE